MEEIVMGKIIAIIFGVLLIGMVVLLCLFSCVVASWCDEDRDDRHWF